MFYRHSRLVAAVPDIPDFLWTYLPDHDGHAAVQVTWLPAVTGHPGSHFYVQYRRKGEPPFSLSSRAQVCFAERHIGCGRLLWTSNPVSAA